MSHAQLSRSSSECRIYQNLFRYTSYRQIGGTRTFMGPYIDKFGMKAAKIFSCTWIDDNRIALGCRDGSVHIADLSTLPWTIRTLSHTSALPTDEGPAGALAMRKNEALGLLASSHGDGKSIGIWDAETLQERCQFKGFKEFVYDADWLNEQTLIAVGQKSEICVWKLSPRALDKGSASPLHNLKGPHVNEFRCVRTLNPLSKFMAVTLDSHFVLYDSHFLLPIYSVQHADWSPSRCCAWSPEHSACLVGNNNTIASFDPREQRIQFIVTFGESRSVRSISADGHRITFTTSSGKVAFMDFRMPRLLPVLHDAPTALQPFPWLHRSSNHYQVLKGYVAPGPFLFEQFDQVPIEQSLFTHAYDSSGLRLFVGGGPTLQGLGGSTAGILY